MTKQQAQYQHPNIVEIEKTPSALKIKIFFGTALIVGIVVLAFFFRWQVGAVILVLGALAARRLWVSIERQKTINSADGRMLEAEVGQAEEGLEITKAERRQAEAQARHAEAEARAAEIDLKRAAIGTRLHYFAKVGVLYFHNDGSYDLLRERRQLTAKEEAAQLAAENPAPGLRPSLVSVFTQPGTVYGIGGPQRSGKSWQAGHLADYWLSLGIVPTVVGPKCDNPGYDWFGCNTIIDDDKATIEGALRAIMAEAAARQKLLKAERTPAPVFLDDWQGTIRIVGKLAYDFISLAATTGASSGLVIYFLMQGDTTAAYGLKELGAMMKNNFMRLSVIPIPDPAGLIVPGQSRGELVYPNATEAIPVELIEGRPACFPDPAAAEAGAVIEGQPSPPIPLIPEDKIRAALGKDPEASYSKLQLAGWQVRGGSKNEERKAIIDEIRQETART